MKRLALFDLDHTLVPFDSGLRWLNFLVGQGALPAAAADDYLASCRAYVAGALDIEGLHRACVAPLAGRTPEALRPWQRAFEAAIAPALPEAMRALVRSHLHAGDRCAIVTATTRLVAEPFARLFGVPHLLATEAALRDGRLTGAVAGLACHREHKPAHVAAWLAAGGESLDDFERTSFYSDAYGDLPLLEAVSEPVAVRPDARLRAHAVAKGWRIVD